MKKISLLLLLCLGGTAISAQKKLSMEDAVLGLNTFLAPKNLKQILWIPGQNAFTQIINHDAQEALIRTKVPSMKVDTLMYLSRLREQTQDSVKTFPEVAWLHPDTFYFSIQHKYYLGHQQGKNWVIRPWTGNSPYSALPEEATNIVVEKNKRHIAYTLKNNLYLFAADGKMTPITSDMEPHILNGQSVHRNEFGIDGGIFFSPKGNHLAFYRMDETMVADYPIIDWATTPAKNENIKYPMAGQTSHQVKIGVYNLATGKTIFLETGKPEDQYLTCVTWSPDETSIYVAVLNRQQNHMWLNQYNAQNGQLTRTLFEETDPKYVEPQHALMFLPGNEFIWWSQRDGYMHLYRYNQDGKLLNQVTKGNWLVNDVLGIHTKKKELVITASKESALEKHIYAVNWTTGKTTRLDKHPGIHQGQLSDEGSYLIDRYQNNTTPRNIELLSTEKAKIEHTLLQSPDPLAAYALAKVEQVQLKADDGTTLFGKLIYPTTFDSTKKYPVIVYLYNGPHVQLVTNSYPASGNLWYDYLAERGYFVFVMDGRGSSNRGLAFEQATFRQLGTAEIDDQLKGVAYLKSLPFIDADRMGVHGWSFGGFMTTALMLRQPGIFKCAVAGGPVIDWSLYEVMYTERYMDTPQENPEGYEQANLLSKAPNLKGKLLMIHGAQDDVVVWQHSIKFVKACVDKGVQLDYFVYPGHPHNVRGKDRVHLMQKITDYFDLHLK